MKMIPAALVCAMLALFAVPGVVLAEPPAKKMTQAPGYYRMALGDFEITTLYDGGAVMPASLLKGPSPRSIEQLLKRAYIDPATGMPIAVNTFLVNTGTNLVLVDTGAGVYFGAKAGYLPAHIKAAGYDPAQVDTVLLTHLHGDHVLGLADKDGRMVFPNAVVRVARQEADYWLSEDTLAKAAPDRQKTIKAVRAAVELYASAGKFKTFALDEDLLPGVSVVPLLGHTPGHCGFLFASQGKELLAWGDIVHSSAVQFANPSVAIEFDVDQKAAVATRKRVLGDAAREEFFVAGAHLPFPGIGRVRSEGKNGYAYVPVLFGPVDVNK